MGCFGSKPSRGGEGEGREAGSNPIYTPPRGTTKPTPGPAKVSKQRLA